MSIQNTINKVLTTKEGKFQRTVTLIDEEGDAVIPPNCNITFLNCKITSLEVQGNSAIMIGGIGSKLTGTYVQEGGQLTLSDFQITGDITLNRVRCTQKGCAMSGQLTLVNSVYDAYNNIHRGNKPYAIRASEGSKLTISDCEYLDWLTCLEIEYGNISLREATLLAKLIALDVSQESQVEIYSGQYKGPEDVGIKAQSSTVRISNVSKSHISGNRAGLQAENSEITFRNGVGFQGVVSGVSLRDSVFTASNFQTIESDSSHGMALTNSRADIAKGNSVLTNGGAAAVYLSDHSRIRASRVKEFVSVGSTAIIFEDDCQLEITNADKISSRSGHGIKMGSRNSAVLIDIPVLLGGGGDGFYVEGTGCTLNATRVDSIRGKNNGISSLNDLTVTTTDVKEIAGGRSKGINVVGKLVLTLNNNATITGEQSDAIVGGSASLLRGVDVGRIVGVNGSAIILGAHSDLAFRRYTHIEGTMAHAIDMPGGRVRLEDGGEIWGMHGAGIKTQDGNGGDVYVKNVGKIHGIEGAGINVAKGIVFVDGIEILAGGGAGVALRSGSSGDIRNVTTKLNGGDEGILADGGSYGKITNVKLLTGHALGALRATNKSTIEAFSIEDMSAGPDTIYANSSKIVLHSANISAGDVRIENGASVSLARVDSSANLFVSDSALDMLQVSFEGTGELQNSGVIAVNSEIATSLLVIGSGVVAAKCNFPNCVLSEGGVIKSAGAGDFIGFGSVLLADGGSYSLPVSGLSSTEGVVLIQGNQIIAETG